MVKIERIEGVFKRNGELFLRRFLSENERLLFKTPQSWAGVWAAKEALSKALGCGIGAEFSFLDVELRKNERGQPFFHAISPKFEKLKSSVSISHDGGFAIAVVAVEP